MTNKVRCVVSTTPSRLGNSQICILKPPSLKSKLNYWTYLEIVGNPYVDIISSVAMVISHGCHVLMPGLIHSATADCCLILATHSHTTLSSRDLVARCILKVLDHFPLCLSSKLFRIAIHFKETLFLLFGNSQGLTYLKRSWSTSCNQSTVNQSIHRTLIVKPFFLLVKSQ